MPITTTDYLLTPTKTRIKIAVEPAQNGFESLLLLNPANSLSGYDEWVTKTVASLPPEILHQNEIVTLGLHYAVVPMRSWSSFPAYIDHLAAQNPESLRDTVLDMYMNLPCKEPVNDSELKKTAVLSSVGSFLDFLYSRFDSKLVDIQVESESYQLLTNPSQMQETIVSHMRWMWDNVLAAEWERRLPLLQASVEAFQQINLDGLTAVEAAQQIIGKDLPENLEKMLNSHEYEQIVFVPSAHVGPYLGKLSGDNTFWILFGARQPEGLLNYPDLSRSELLIRLSALADDNRLRILNLLSRDGEKCAQEIIQMLDLSQSAASRHLKQLGANGFLSERRRENGKCYIVNLDRIESTFHALLNFLDN
jgi:DNA-binding transcriptional ArsR family regulator